MLSEAKHLLMESRCLASLSMTLLQLLCGCIWADTVAPRSATGAIVRLVGSRDKQELVVEAGHLGIVVGCAAMTEVWSRVADWLDRRD